MNDLVSDCENAEDEPVLKTILVKQSAFQCENTSFLPCLLGHTKCYNISDLCIYRTDKDNHLYPCRNGAHLESCQLFECNLMHKCSQYYCIPWEYVCDHSWDCPMGTDESSSCSSQDCSFMFKCIGMNVLCIHLGVVCDGQKNCPHADDEYFCDHKNTLCPNSCHCWLSHVMCEHTALEQTEVLNKLSVVVLINSTFLRTLFATSRYTIVFYSFLDLPQTIACKILPRENLIGLNLRKTHFLALEEHCWKDIKSLVDIQVTKSGLELLEPNALVNLLSLQILNMSENSLTTFPKNVLINCPKLRTISILRTRFESIDANAFVRMHFQVLETLCYKDCCAVHSDVQCVVNKPWYASCHNLLPNNAVVIVFLSVSAVILFSNVFSFALGILGRKSTSTSFTTTTACVNATELFFAVYLCSISIADWQFGQSFIYQESTWRSSWKCHTLSQLLVFFNATEPLLLSLVSISRLQVIKHPITSRFKTTTFTVNVLDIFCLLQH